jgi:regulation of enolase protein 1 (concanavalin A-like superfamily)
MDFKYANFPAAGPFPTPDSEGVVTLKTTAKTDVWRKPPAHDVFNAPFMYKSLPISRFKSARVSAIGEWNTLYDQGGLMIVLPATKSRPTSQKRWIKTGIEFYHGKPMMSVVAADLWADWSLLPLSPTDEKEGRMSVIVEREEEEGGWGSVLKISLLGNDGATPIREVTWAFHDLDEEEEMWVGIAVAKPTMGEKDELAVRFEGFKIETRD